MISRLRLREARISEIEIATVAMQVLLRADANIKLFH
jgi:hypothetical protein